MPNLTPTVVKVILSGLTHSQMQSDARRSVSSASMEVNKLVGQCVVIFLKRTSMFELASLENGQGVSQMAAMALGWVVTNCTGDVLDSGVEILVEAFIQDAATQKDVFELPLDTQQVRGNS